MVRYGDVLALTYTGELDLADERAADYANFSSAGQFLAWAIAKITIRSQCATHRGDFPAAISSLEQALAALAAEAPLPWRLPHGCCWHGPTRRWAARETPNGCWSTRRSTQAKPWPCTSPQRTLANACLLAAKGLERGAVESALSAADQAQDFGQFAVEAEALHHAARFGARASRGSACGTLRQGPRPGGRAAGPARGGGGGGTDPEALVAASIDLEQAGLLLSAADSAARRPRAALRQCGRPSQRRRGGGACPASCQSLRRRGNARREDRGAAVTRDRPRTGDRRTDRRRTDQQGDRRAAGRCRSARSKGTSTARATSWAWPIATSSRSSCARSR